MKKLISTIVTKIRHSKSMVKSSAKTIHEQDTFQNLIELERDRVHRNNHQFSLLLIRISGKNDVKHRITELVKNISKRVRKTDQLGWYDENHLGILLPDTANTGAQVFENEIRKCQKSCEVDIVLKTISYPYK